MKKYIVILIVLLTSGCMSNYNPEDYYDLNASQIPARIISRNMIKIRDANKAYFDEAHQQQQIMINTVTTTPPGASPEGVILGILFINLLGAYGPDISYPSPYTYEYKVETNNKQILMLLHEHSGFSVGDCVTVFVSNNPKRYPTTMAYGDGCKMIPNKALKVQDRASRA